MSGNTNIPRLKQHGKLGSGLFGEVFAVSLVDEHNVELQGDLAVKYLKDEWLHNEEVRERFKAEVRLLRRLRHDHILRVEDSNLSAARPYILMPVAQDTLYDRLMQGEATNREWALRTFAALVDGVAHAHDQDVIHRDLKPGNVLFVDDILKVADFGLGKNLAPDATKLFSTHHAFGTPAYMAPEQHADPKSVGKPADVFALGKMLWELLVNRAPIIGLLSTGALAEVDDEPLRRILTRACDEEPSLRYRDAGELQRAFLGVLGELGPRRSPAEQLQELIDEWHTVDVGPNIRLVRRIDSLLNQYADAEQLYNDFVPYLPPQLVAQYAREFPSQFAQMLDRYSAHIAGRLPFSYCDDVAAFYKVVFDNSAEPSVRQATLARLLRLGAIHNRYLVADIVRELLASVKDDATATLTARAVRETPEAHWYVHWQLFRLKLHPLVRRAFQELKEPPADDDIPF